MIHDGGYDVERPPIDTFEADMQAGGLSFGDYDGSTFVNGQFDVARVPAVETLGGGS